MNVFRWVKIESLKHSVSRTYAHPLFWFVLIGLVLRFSIAPFTAHAGDISIWFRRSMSVMYGTNPYDSISEYPPLWLYSIGGILRLSIVFVDPRLFYSSLPVVVGPPDSPIGIVTSPIFNLLYKTPLIISDTLTGLILYKFMKKHTNGVTAKRGFILWFFNPLVIWVSSIHGQIDVLSTMMTLTACISAIEKKYFFAGIALAMAILFKLYPLVLLPLYVMYALRNADANLIKRRGFYSMLILGLGVLVGAASFVTLPLITNPKFLEYQTGRQSSPEPSFGGINIWFMTNHPQGSVVVNFLKQFPYFFSNLPILVFIFASLVCIATPFSKYTYKGFVSWHVVFLALVLFLGAASPAITNPQWLVWLIPFLILEWRPSILYNLSFHLYWISAIAFVISLTGITYFFYPLTVHTPLLSADFIQTSTMEYYLLPGYLGGTLRQDLIFLSTIPGVIALIVILFSKPKNVTSKVRLVVRKLRGDNLGNEP